MIEEKIEEFKKEVETLGPMTRAMLLISCDHDGVVRIKTEGDMFNLVFMKEQLGIFLAEILSGRLQKKGEQDVP